MNLRGASDEEVTEAVTAGQWKPAKLEKLQSRHTFEYTNEAPTNMKFHKFEIVEATFVDEDEPIVIIAVKVYYSNTEGVPARQTLILKKILLEPIGKNKQEIGCPYGEALPSFCGNL
jgi:hypothetical protein